MSDKKEKIVEDKDKRKVCKACGGSGLVELGGDKACEVCNGSGRVGFLKK